MNLHIPGAIALLASITLGAPSPAQAELGLYCSVFPGRIECRLLPIPLPPHLRHHLPDAPLLFSPKPLSQAPRTIEIGEHRYALTAEASMRERPAPAPPPSRPAAPEATPEAPLPIDTQADPREEGLRRPRMLTRRTRGARFQIQLVARYRIAATVLSRSGVQRDLLAPLAPVDFALGWGAVGKHLLDADLLRLRHDGRWLHRHLSSGSGLEPDYVWQHSSNNHVIPASTPVRLILDSLVAGDRVELEGYLVNVWRHGGGTTTWRSSRSRTDSGDNSCEIMFVTQARKER